MGCTTTDLKGKKGTIIPSHERGCLLCTAAIPKHTHPLSSANVVSTGSMHCNSPLQKFNLWFKPSQHLHFGKEDKRLEHGEHQNSFSLFYGTTSLNLSVRLIKGWFGERAKNVGFAKRQKREGERETKIGVDIRAMEKKERGGEIRAWNGYRHPNHGRHKTKLYSTFCIKTDIVSTWQKGTQHTFPD